MADLEQLITDLSRAATEQYLASRPTKITPRYLTVKQAGEYMGTTAKVVYHMIYRKQLVPIYVSKRSIRIDKEQIDAMMACRTR